MVSKACKDGKRLSYLLSHMNLKEKTVLMLQFWLVLSFPPRFPFSLFPVFPFFSTISAP